MPSRHPLLRCCGMVGVRTPTPPALASGTAAALGRVSGAERSGRGGDGLGPGAGRALPRLGAGQMSEALENVARIVDGGDQTYPAGVGEHVLLLEGAEFQHLD